MKKLADKTLLNFSINTMEQDLPSILFGRSLFRNAGLDLELTGDFKAGSRLTGTSLDDTVVIDGNIYGSEDQKTEIDLSDGNDNLTVNGNLILNGFDQIRIEGGLGKNTVNINGGIEYNRDYTGYDKAFWLSIDLYGDENNTLNIEGPISGKGLHDYSHIVFDLGNFRSQTGNNILNINNEMKLLERSYVGIEMNGAESQLNIAKNIYLVDNSNIYTDFSSDDISINIHSDVTISHESSFYNSLNNTDKSTAQSKSNIEFGGRLLLTDNSIFSFDVNQTETHASFKDISIHDDSTIIIIDHGTYGNSNWLFDGDIVASNYSDVDWEFTQNLTIDVTGAIVLQQSDIKIETASSDVTFLNGISNNNGSFSLLTTINGNQNVYIEGDIVAAFDPSLPDINADSHATLYNEASNVFLSKGNSNHFTLIGDLIASGHSHNEFSTSQGSDTISIIGNITASDGAYNNISTNDGNDNISVSGDFVTSNGGKNTISAGAGDDVITLNGHIAVNALEVSGGDGNDILVLTANTQKLFEADYKDWLTDLSNSGALAKSGLETIRLDVHFIQQNKLGWLTDIVNKANADGAHIAVEDKTGHQLVNPSTYLAQSNDTHTPINDVLDHYAPATANTVQPKAFAENIAHPSADAFAKPHFDNNNFLHEMEQQAQVHAAAVA